MTIYTRERMIEEWKYRTGFVDFRKDCSVERDDGLDINEYIVRRIDECYDRLLREAPFEAVPLTNIAQEVNLTVLPDMSGVVALPDNCLRVAEVRLSGWKKLVKCREFAGDDLAAQQTNEWIRGGVNNPVVVQNAGTLNVYSLPDPNARVELLLCVLKPEPNLYIFQESAWHLLIDYDKKLKW